MTSDQRSADADREELRALNERIGAAEDAGDRAFLDGVLAPRLAFQRADPARTVDDRDGFLAKVAPGGPRTTRIVEPIQVHGDRAVVVCVVATGGQEFHNIRLFVRREGAWRLLGWANEKLTA